MYISTFELCVAPCSRKLCLRLQLTSFSLFPFLVVRSDLEPIQKVAKETTDSVARVVIFPLTEAVAASESLPRSETLFMEM